jgi:hypothetical protein
MLVGATLLIMLWESSGSISWKGKADIYISTFYSEALYSENLYFQTNTIDTSKTLIWFVLPCLE